MDRVPPTIDMLPDGSFRQPPPHIPAFPMAGKLMVAAVAVAIIGTAVLVAIAAIWLISMILPVVLIAAAIAYGLYRYRRWQLFRGHPGPLGPYQPGRFRE